MIKKMISLLILLSVTGMAILPVGVQARQETVPYVFDTTIPVNEEVRAALDAWLPQHNPSSGMYYAITYVRSDGINIYTVCLAAFDLASPEEKWSITTDEGESKLIWLGTVRVNADATVDLLTEPQESEQSGIPHFAVPVLPAPGGGSSIRWPFESGKSVMYGPNGVHGIGYSSYGSGMVAVDLVGGSDFGSGSARNYVYASADGDIDYVCTDGTSDAIRVNDGSGNKFIYAHLIHNSTLEMDHSFNKGDSIGSMVSGSFDDDCGDASQTDNHWHVHWGFVPANNAFTVQNCVINSGTDTITCDTTKINPGQFVTNNGATGSDDRASTTPSFWDYMLIGFLNVFDRGILKLLPEHSSPVVTAQVILNAIRFVMKVNYALLVSNFNLGPGMAALFLAITFRGALFLVWLVFAVLRTIKSLPFA